MTVIRLDFWIIHHWQSGTIRCAKHIILISSLVHKYKNIFWKYFIKLHHIRLLLTEFQQIESEQKRPRNFQCFFFFSPAKYFHPKFIALLKFGTRKLYSKTMRFSFRQKLLPNVISSTSINVCWAQSIITKIDNVRSTRYLRKSLSLCLFVMHPCVETVSLYLWRK